MNQNEYLDFVISQYIQSGIPRSMVRNTLASYGYSSTQVFRLMEMLGIYKEKRRAAQYDFFRIVGYEIVGKNAYRGSKIEESNGIKRG